MSFDKAAGDTVSYIKISESVVTLCHIIRPAARFLIRRGVRRERGTGLKCLAAREPKTV